MKRNNPEKAAIFSILAGMLWISFCALPLQAQEADDPGRESIVRSNSGKEIVITSYDPAPGAEGQTQKEKIRTKRIYSNWISNALAQWRRTEIPGSNEWPRMRSRELIKAYQSYLRFLKNIEVESSGYLVLITEENDRRKIISRLIKRTTEKIRSLQSGS